MGGSSSLDPAAQAAQDEKSKLGEKFDLGFEQIADPTGQNAGKLPQFRSKKDPNQVLGYQDYFSQRDSFIQNNTQSRLAEISRTLLTGLVAGRDRSQTILAENPGSVIQSGPYSGTKAEDLVKSQRELRNSRGGSVLGG